MDRRMYVLEWESKDGSMRLFFSFFERLQMLRKKQELEEAGFFVVMSRE